MADGLRWAEVPVEDLALDDMFRMPEEGVGRTVFFDRFGSPQVDGETVVVATLYLRVPKGSTVEVLRTAAGTESPAASDGASPSVSSHA